MGIMALGLVVVNVGALYRLRYFFLILMIILAAAGAAQALDWYRREPAIPAPHAGCPRGDPA
jgi:hypothetical protein